ncbi:CBS domain-containing protein [Catalinimonas alkaloidigena]|uniref:CBS domain-containing protein n=1 Tax=Catalinimonas alkaloidigena TaxID=1075417 RepID=UPI0024060F3A|nr:CBS domain-containing protein [Catalinimonas alkaloidigena]MDF9795056.1 CBS domain-containing protein [Catalinimonas alkaloidigena]
MGEHSVNSQLNHEKRAAFIRHLLDDLQALEYMLAHGLIEDDIVRIGAEQEFCLVNNNWRPTKNAEQVLKSIDDPHFTTEIARYNLEINLDPQKMNADCFSRLEKQLNSLLAKAKAGAEKHDTKIVLSGILPTISKNELELEYMTPTPRYRALNEMIKTLRGTDFSLHLRGVDELTITHNSVLFEACNTSFQLHLQIAPQDFIASYNWAQAISGPVLGICANSPLLLGRELWSETRIALFQQSIDTRSSSYALKDQQGRVSFGNAWASGSIAEIFKDNIAQHKVILSREIGSNAMEELQRGNTPKLEALNLHNGTVYRWNRPCYGVGGGRAHVRIENRYIPAGPTVLDEMANFAFWVGLMKGRPAKFEDMSGCMDFRDAKANFIKAARTGKETILHWMGKSVSVEKLVTNELLPMAYIGLQKVQIDRKDIDRLLGIIERRTQGKTGAQWQVESYRNFRKQMKQDDALLALTKAIYEHQQTDFPVHQWPKVESKPAIHKAAEQVGHIMSTQMFTVHEGDLATLATSMMQWKNIHHVPVENQSGKLCGLLTWSHMESQKKENKGDERTVADIMIKEVVTVQYHTKISEAIQLMKKHEIGCLPVVHEQDLVGIITKHDISAFLHGEGK